MKMYMLTHMLWSFNMMLDSGKYDHVSVSDIKSKIRNGTITKYLTSQFPDADFSLIEPGDWAYLTHEWDGYADHLDERKKMGVENRGICLLLGYTLNLLQQHPDNPRNK